MGFIQQTVSKLLRNTPLGYVPTRIRRGPAKGIRWTLGPFSNNWRTGGEGDMAIALNRLGDLRGKTAWDFGAHFGIATVAAAQAVGEQGQVVAFEPDPVAFARLSYHCQINHLSHVKLLQAAASDRTAEMPLFSNAGLGSTTGTLDSVCGSHMVAFVQAVRPDDLFTSGEIRAPSLLKIDVEGHAAASIRGSLEAIREGKPLIIYSLHSRDEVEAIAKYLLPLGYVAKSLDFQPIDLGNHPPIVILE